MKIIFPKKMESSVQIGVDLLYRIQSVFDAEEKMLRNFELDLSSVTRINIIGVLILYKFMSYSLDKRCYDRPKVYYSTNEVLKRKIEEYGFNNLIYGLINNAGKKGEDKMLKKLKIKNVDNFLIAPRALFQSDSTKWAELNKNFFSEIQSYYHQKEAQELILQILSEIMLNFWTHATEDASSVIVAVGDKTTIEVAYADTGNGIISTMQECLTHQRPPCQVMQLAMVKGVTSKPQTPHLGQGLWWLNEFANRNDGQITVLSEGVYYQKCRNRTKCCLTGYWKGTIIWISLRLDNIQTLSSIPEDDNVKKIRLNLGDEKN